jgi:hypothetical protein
MSKVRSSITGYTIVETMIFLAVSGAIFFTAMLLVNGQQRRTEFATTVRDFDSKLQSVISNVASGYYNDPGQFTCTVTAGVMTITPTASTQGQNSDCTFVGQFIDLAPSPNNNKFTITSIAGARRVGDKEATSVLQLYSAGLLKPITETAETYTLPNGVIASYMKIITPVRNIPTIAVFTTFNQYKDPSNSSTLSSGSSRSDIWGVDISVPFAAPNPPSGIEICLTDGEQYGSIILNTGSTRVTMGNGSTCP